MVGEYAFAYLTVYLAPAIIAFVRKHKDKWAILALDFVFAWTIIIWFFALFWSLTGNTEVKK